MYFHRSIEQVLESPKIKSTCFPQLCLVVRDLLTKDFPRTLIFKIHQLFDTKMFVLVQRKELE